ncbi:HotDog domain-containing protein [Emericellopsis atlantica]|uniref:HotDog domain-containing protein n=1 Tax=Emericellopsis atlantica TaxID=2614577 RepID=A0A9P8CRI2_9HYPO|nr:HotDog domain-containing protein [Emericellopsis atlantica]KAG9254746.1 HotDog domain-containing protein [Emericellopsis atlantica]
MSKRLTPKVFTQSVLRAFMKESGLEPTLLGANRFRITDASNGRVDFELDIHQNHTNRLQTIHGGTLAAMVDLGGSLAVASTGRFATGVTTDLNVSYLSPGGKAGDLLTGTAICDKIGKTLAYTTITFKNSKGQLAARGSHTKYVAGTLGEDGPFVAPAKYVEELD